MNWGQIGVKSATIACEAANAAQASAAKGLVVGRFLVVEPTGLEPVTPCLQSGGITGYEVRSARRRSSSRQSWTCQWWHRC